MRIIKSLFHFLGSIHFAIALIAVAALTVVLGTILESKSGSHLAAARWTYAHPFFQLLLSLFFVNILFSALRRWPFKKKHLPFLMTHLGLLMIISGTLIKNRFGLQGQLSVWEGSGSQQVLLPQTYALSIEEKGNPSGKSLVTLDSFQQSLYHLHHFPHLKCKLVRYAPHVKEHYDTWIKDTHAYIAGFPLIPVQTWEPSQPFPEWHSHPFALAAQAPYWSVMALRTSEVQEAFTHAYLQGLTLRLKTTDPIDIPLRQAIEKPVIFADGQLFITLALERQELHFKWQALTTHQEATWTVPLQGQDALLLKSSPERWIEPPFTVDLLRSQPALCFVDDTQGNTCLFAFDTYGRLFKETFSSTHVQTLLSYDQGFSGYGVQTGIPFPSFPADREAKERARLNALLLRLQPALAQAPALTPPLSLFKQACEQAQVDCAKAFVAFLSEWHNTPALLFYPMRGLSPSLQAILAKRS